MKIEMYQAYDRLWYLNVMAPDRGLLFRGVRGYKTKRNAAAAGMRLLKGMQRAVVVL
jgi:hypothetical protein